MTDTSDMRVAIIDDNRQAAQSLADKLRAYDGVSIVGEALNGTDGLALIRDRRPDVLFLDVELPDLSGLDFLDLMERIDGGECRVVMYTAYDRYMLPAFRHRAFDFLVKPVDDAELRTVMRRLCLAPHRTRPEETARPATQTDAAIQQRGDGKYLLYTGTADFRLVDVRDIGVFTYNHDLRQWEVSVSGCAEPIRLRRTVNSDALLALDDRLVRVSQRHIINLAYLLEVVDNVCRFYPPFDTVSDVKVGRFFRKKLIDRFCSL